MSKFRLLLLAFIVLVAATATAIFWQQHAVNQLQRENETLRQQVAQIAPLQTQLDHASQEAAAAGGGADVQLHELARLRAEVSRLRGKTNELSQTTQQSQTLNQTLNARMESETGALQGQVATLQAQLQKGQSVQAANACINNLRLIDSAKQQWALENRKRETDIPVASDLIPYLGHGPNPELPACPAGGVYTFNAINQKPTCNIPGHALP